MHCACASIRIYLLWGSLLVFEAQFNWFYRPLLQVLEVVIQTYKYLKVFFHSLKKAIKFSFAPGQFEIVSE